MDNEFIILAELTSLGVGEWENLTDLLDGDRYDLGDFRMPFFKDMFLDREYLIALGFPIGLTSLGFLGGIC